jgi:PAS domain S-box-containing protein
VNEREGRQRLRFLLDALAEAIYTVDADGRCTFCNTACLDLLGFDRMEQVVGRSMHELMHQGRADATAEAACPICRSHRCDERVHVDDATLWRADGSSFAAECWAHPLTWHGPTVIAAVVTFLDVTRRREAEEESLRLNLELEARVCDRTAQLESANRELEAFSYSVSHDLRAPLRAIDGFAEILAADHSQQLGDEGLRVLGVIRRNVGKMGHLIDGLLQFSRLGRKDIHAELVDMGALASSVLEELVTQETERHIETRVGDLPPVAGDPVLLHQVWMNLLGNAVKYSGRRRDAVVQVDASESGGEVVYTVRDNGVGFDMTYVDKVFGVFQRLHKESEFPGTGLGLALVQRIVARHHGRVWAESVVDEGAAFHFALPGIRSEVD